MKGHEKVVYFCLVLVFACFFFFKWEKLGMFV